MHNDKKAFAKRLRRAMVERGHTAQSLSEAADVCASSVSMYLSGHNIPKRGALDRIAAALGVGVDFFEAPPPDESPETGVSEGQADGPPPKKITCTDAARALGINVAAVYYLLRGNKVPWGVAFKGSGQSYRYVIYPKLFREVAGE